MTPLRSPRPGGWSRIRGLSLRGCEQGSDGVPYAPRAAWATQTSSRCSRISKSRYFRQSAHMAKIFEKTSGGPMSGNAACSEFSLRKRRPNSPAGAVNLRPSLHSGCVQPASRNSAWSTSRTGPEGIPNRRQGQTKPRAFQHGHRASKFRRKQPRTQDHSNPGKESAFTVETFGRETKRIILDPQQTSFKSEPSGCGVADHRSRRSLASWPLL